MGRRIKTKDLAIGMFVELPLSWSEHPFLTNRFKIKSKEQLEKIRSCAPEFVTIDEKLGAPAPPTTHETVSPTDVAHPQPGSGNAEDPRDGEKPIDWTPENLAPIELLEALHDQTMPSEQKAKAVYQHSKVLMERMLQSPTAKNINASKQVISSITDLVLTDDDTANNLLRITSHDFYTYTHSVNVGITALMLAKALFKGSDAHDLHEMGAGFFLHDLGKVNVRSEVINKPGKLTDAEMAHMRIHPYQGYKLLKEANALSDECKYIVMQHHEFHDGTGYPKRLKGDEIHRYARICCIADVFDALTAERSYKKAMKPFDALRLMKEQMSEHFDRELFSEFVLLFHKSGNQAK